MSGVEIAYSPKEIRAFREGLGVCLPCGTWRHMAAFHVIYGVFTRFRENVLPNGDLRKRSSKSRKRRFEFNLSLQRPKRAFLDLGDKNRTVCIGSSNKVRISPRVAPCRRVRALGVYLQVKRIKKALDSFQNRGLESLDYSPKLQAAWC